MAGIRINNSSLGVKTFTQAKNFKLLIDEASEPEASTILVKLLGNCLIEGSTDGTNWHSIVSTDTLFRISSDGGATYTYTDLNSLYKYYFKNGVPYTSIQSVYDTIPLISRYLYLTVNVSGVEYWFTDLNTIYPKVGTLSIPDGSVTVSKLAPVAHGTVFYKDSAGTGDPQVVPLSVLMIAMSLSNTNTGDETKGSIESKLLLTAPSTHFVQNDELTGYIPVTPGSGLITDTDLLRLQSVCSVFTITLPSASTVAGRVASAVAGVNYPIGWTLTADGIDIIITHNLDRRIASVSVFSDASSVERQLFGNAAYSGIYQSHSGVYNQVAIEALATVETNIVIELIFAGSVTPATITPTTAPTVETYTPSNITLSSFDTGGTVTDDGNSAVLSRGICYGLTTNPTILGSYQQSGSGVGFFYNNIIGLSPSTTYYYRAYATNAVGTSYGINVNFTTHSI